MSWTVDFTSDSSANVLLLPVWLTSNGLSSVHDAGWGVACRLYMLNQVLLAFLRYLQLFSNHLLPSPGLRSNHSSSKVTLPLFFLYFFFADAQSLVGVALCGTVWHRVTVSCLIVLRSITISLCFKTSGVLRFLQSFQLSMSPPASNAISTIKCVYYIG